MDSHSTPLRHRDVDLDHDRDLLLEYHCYTDYVSESPLETLPEYAKYRAFWLQSPQPDEYLSALRQTMQDPRGLVKVLLDEDGAPIGYFWATFTDVPAYHFAFAEIQDLYIVDAHRRTGLGSAVVAYVEMKTKEAGVHVLRSGTGAGNTASMRLHEKTGFITYRCEFEKRL